MQEDTKHRSTKSFRNRLKGLLGSNARTNNAEATGPRLWVTSKEADNTLPANAVPAHPDEGKLPSPDTIPLHQEQPPNDQTAAGTQTTEASSSKEYVERSKVKQGLETASRLVRECLEVTKAVSPVFPPLQAVAGGLLAIADVFKMHADNNDTLRDLQTELQRFTSVVSAYKDSNIPDEPLNRLLSCLERELKQADEKLSRGYFIGLVNARAVSGDVVTMLRNIDSAFRAFQAEFTLSIRHSIQRQERHKIAEWITDVTFDNAYTDALDKYTPGTAEWFFHRETFKEWKEGKHPVLWCYGNPGVGKTILSSLIINHLQRLYYGQNSVVLFLYCRHHIQHDLATLLKALLRQLVHRSVRTQFLLDIYADRTPLDLKLVISALETEMATYDAVFVIADAVDELHASLQVEFVRKLKSLKPFSTHLHVLFTSRPTIAGIVQPCAEVAVYTHRDDLDLYITERWEKVSPDAGMKGLKLDDIKEKVIHKADGMFLMAQLHFDALEACWNVAQVKNTLDTLPSSLHDRYIQTLGRIDPSDRKLALEVLSWVAFSPVSLTVDDVRYALAAARSANKLDEAELISPQLIIRLCVGLVLVRKEPQEEVLSFVHYTVKEHLTTLNDLLSPETMVSTCVKYLGFPTSIPDIKKFDHSVLYHHYLFPPFSLAATRSMGCFLQKVEDVSKLPSWFMSDSRITRLLIASVVDHRFGSRVGFEAGEICFIHFAAYHNLSRIIHHLIQSDATLVNITIGRGYTPLMYAALNKSHEALQELLDNGGCVNTKDWDGRTPLSYAARSGSETIVKALIGCVGIDMQDNDGRTPLSYAAETGAVEALIATGSININSQDEQGRTPLSYAAASGNENAVKVLLTVPSISIDLRDKHGRTPLSYAASARNGANVAVKALLSTAAVDVNSRDVDGRTPLSYAAERSTEVVKALLAVPGVDVNSRDEYGRTPLSYAADEDILDTLLSIPGVDINSSDERGQTPLSYAAGNRRLGSLEGFLTAPGIDINSQDDDGRTPLTYAAQAGNEGIVKALLGIPGVDVDLKDAYGRTPLSYAATSSNQAIVKSLAAIPGISINSKDREGRCPLSYAAEGVNEGVYTLLATPGVDVNSRDNLGRTPLSYAASGNDLYPAIRRNGIVIALLATPDIDINSRDNLGRTPLSYAAEEGREDLVRAFIATPGVIVGLKDENGRTPLSYAIQQHGARNIIEMLLPSIDADSRDEDGRDLLLYAAQAGNEGVVKGLLATPSVDADSKDKGGRTALSYAAERGREDIVKALITVVDDVDTKDKNGRTPLSYAAQARWADATKALLALPGVDADSKDNHGRTPLSYAAEIGNGGAVKALIARGVDVNSRDDTDRTPLSYAQSALDIEGRAIQVVRVILSVPGIDVDSRDKHGRTPLSYAAEHGDDRKVKALIATASVDVNSRDELGRTPLSYAWDGDVVRVLLAIPDIDIDSRDKHGRTPLSYGAQAGCSGAIEVLIAAGADANSRDEDGRTPLSYATEAEEDCAGKILLSVPGVDADSSDNLGRTPLSHAAQLGQRDLVKALIATQRVDVNSRDNNGRTPLSYAAEYGSLCIAKAFLAVRGIQVDSRDNTGRSVISYAAAAVGPNRVYYEENLYGIRQPLPLYVIQYRKRRIVELLIKMAVVEESYLHVHPCLCHIPAAL